MGKSLMEDLVIEKLMTVYDPEVPVNIWELGLVYGIEFPKKDEVIVTMTLRPRDALLPIKSFRRYMMSL